MTTSPISFYKDLIARQSQEISQLNSKSRFYITGKLIAFCLLVLSVYQTWHTQSVWLIIPCLITAGCYIFLLLADSKCQSTLSRLGKLHTVCANEIKYLKGDYSPFNDGKAYINPHHEYSYDLDIFGPRSLFQRINRTITEEGSKHLAYMLTHPEHNPQHITDRQDAVREISTLTQWRLKFQSLPYTNNHIKTIAEAIERQHLQYPLRRYQILSYLSVTCTIVSLLTALSGFAPWIVFGVLFLTQMAISFLRAKHTVINTQHTGKLHQEYKNYIEILKLAEQAQFRSALLKTAQKELLYSEKSCLKSFRQLSRILNLQDQRYSGIVYILLNGLFLYDIILNNMFEKWARTYMPLVGHWLKAIAQIDSIASLGTYAFNHPQNTYAECLTEDSEFIIEATDLYHPFITSEKAITNNFSLTRHHCILITGANMSGKSTFLRAIGVNYLLANIGAPVCAKTFKYGSTKDYVLDLQVVMADGRILRTGSNTVKNATGYNLSTLFVGSEGTLGIVTEAVLKLIPKPEAEKVLMAYFDSVESAVQAVNMIIEQKVFPATIDFMDKNAIQTVEKFYPAGLLCDKECALVIEVDGFKSSIDYQQKIIEDILYKCNAADIQCSHNQEEYERIWTARRSSMGACAKLKPNVTTDDVIVPRENLAKLVRGINKICEKHNLTACIVGHVGDGSVHPQIPIDYSDEDEYKRYKLAKSEIYDLTARLGGIISGEHGIGAEKREYISKVVNNVAIDYMRKIKSTFDPDNILNPYKIF